MKENPAKRVALAEKYVSIPRIERHWGVAGVAARGGRIGGVGGWVNRWQEASGEVRAPAPKEREYIPEERVAGDQFTFVCSFGA